MTDLMFESAWKIGKSIKENNAKLLVAARVDTSSKKKAKKKRQRHVAAMANNSRASEGRRPNGEVGGQMATPARSAPAHTCRGSVWVNVLASAPASTQR